MFTTPLLLSTLFLTLIHANEGIESDDVPSQCTSQCRSVIDLSSTCDDRSFSSNDDELQCICTGQNMASAIPDCEACVRPFWEGSDDDDYDETNNLLRRCGLTAAGATNSGSLTSSSSSTTTMMSTTSSGPSATTSATTSTSTDASGSQTVIVQTTTVDGGVGGPFATPVSGVGFAAFVAAAVIAL